MGAPPAYIKALPAKLQIANMNWGLASSDASALLRLAGDEVRAIVSARYATLDDQTVLSMVARVLGFAVGIDKDEDFMHALATEFKVSANLSHASFCVFLRRCKIYAKCCRKPLRSQRP